MPAFALSPEILDPIDIDPRIAVDVYNGKRGGVYQRAYIAARLANGTIRCMTPGDRVKQARKAKKLTQQELANATAESNSKFSVMNVSRWETNTLATPSFQAQPRPRSGDGPSTPH